MAKIVLSSDGSLILNGTAINDLIAGDAIILAPKNPHSSRANSQESGVTIAKRSDAHVHDMTVKVQKNSDSDIFLNSLRNGEVTLIEGSYKQGFTKDGSEGQESWQLQGGSITTQPSDTKNSNEVDAVAEYMIEFRSAIKNI